MPSLTDSTDADQSSLINLSTAMQVHLPVDVAVSVGRRYNFPMPPPLTHECESLRAMSAERAHEFRLGRYHARLALAQLGISDAPLPVDRTRSPCWPTGTVGSISHSDRHVVALAGRRDRIASLGVDIEVAVALEDEVAELICSTEEIKDLALPVSIPMSLAVVSAFCIKEAIFKAQPNAADGKPIFTDMRIQTEADGRFIARSTTLRGSRAFGTRPVAGRYGFADCAVFAIVASPQ